MKSTNNVYDLSQLEIIRPEKVLWQFNLKSSDILDSIPSKSLRKFFAKSEEILKESGIVYDSKTISEKEYLEWLPYYIEKMNENKYDIIAKPEWYKTQTSNGYTIKKLSFLQEGKQLATGIIILKENLEASISFKASERLSISGSSNSSVGLLLDYYFFSEAKILHCKKIYGGSSRNANGVSNKFGYLESKLKMGYEPLPREDLLSFSSAPLNEDGEVMFFGKKLDEWNLYHIHPIHVSNSFRQSIQGYYSKPIIDITY